MRRFRCDADNFLEVATKYVEKWHDFNDRKYQILDGLRLNTVPAFENLLEIVDSYKISIINHDLLFEEFLTFFYFYYICTKLTSRPLHPQTA